VVVDEADGKRIVDRALAQRKERPLSLAPADMFGANTAGVYQIRTAEMADAVVNSALSGTSSNTGSTASGTREEGRGRRTSALETRTIVSSSRNWWDRPRNERLFLQRCMHTAILLGIANEQYSSTSGEGLGTLGWSLAAFLWLLSNFIMKESLLERVLSGKARTALLRKRR
jgi:hypothetical protein